MLLVYVLTSGVVDQTNHTRVRHCVAINVKKAGIQFFR